MEYNVRLRVQDYVDYIEYNKYTLNRNYSLRGRTALSLTRDIFAMHEANDFAKNERLLKLKWPRTTKEDVSINYNQCEYVFKELTTGKELFLESKNLKHCVFTYSEYCVERYCSIWSLRIKIDSKMESLLTIEVKDKEIVQIRGKQNRDMTEDEAILLSEWAEKMEFYFNYNLD